MERTQEYRIKDIYGQLLRPKRKGKLPLIIFSHSLGSTHASGLGYGQGFVQAGFAFYTFDYRNGSKDSKSGNDMRKMTVLTELSDLEEVICHFKECEWVDSHSIYVLGSSQGGVVATLLASEHPSMLKGLGLLYPAFVIEESIHREFKDLSNVPETFSYHGWFEASKQYVVDVWDLKIYEKLESILCPIVLIHGTDDKTVTISYSRKAHSLFPHISYHEIDGADHGFYEENLEIALSFLVPFFMDIQKK